MEYNNIELTAVERMFRSFVQRYNHEKYWNYRSIVVDPDRGSKIGDLFRLYYIKRADAFNNASMGTHRNFGAVFAEPPQLPHGLNGIIVSHNAVVGKDCRIYHQVTIGEGHDGAPKIGDHVVIGAGTKIVGNISVGDYARIGVGCVITQDIPAHALVLAGEPTVIVKEPKGRNV